MKKLAYEIDYNININDELDGVGEFSEHNEINVRANTLNNQLPLAQEQPNIQKIHDNAQHSIDSSNNRRDSNSINSGNCSNCNIQQKNMNNNLNLSSNGWHNNMNNNINLKRKAHNKAQKINMLGIISKPIAVAIGAFITCAVLNIFSRDANALTFMIPNNGNIIGAVQTAVVQKDESLGDIGRRFDLGVYEMMEANPDVNAWSPNPGTTVTVPAQFILPAQARTGVVINIAEMRMYYFHPDGKQVSTFPIGIGKRGWNTPLCVTKIIDKKKDPTWTPPDSIREAHAEKGDILPDYVGPGPKNPLGKYAMRLGISGYLIHGTNRHGGIGVRSSGGCIRMFPEDIEALFNLTPIGTKVTIINAPYKVTRHGGKIYFEAHEPLTDSYYAIDTEDTLIGILDAANIDRKYFAQLKEIAIDRNNAKGFPMAIN